MPTMEMQCTATGTGKAKLEVLPTTKGLMLRFTDEENPALLLQLVIPAAMLRMLANACEGKVRYWNADRYPNDPLDPKTGQMPPDAQN